MPLDESGDIREKLIHTNGLTSGMKWESVGDHGYSGLFKGAQCGILRFSPTDMQTKDSFSSTVAIKMFRSGVESGNLVFAFTTSGQGNNSNPFWHVNISNIIILNLSLHKF